MKSLLLNANDDLGWSSRLEVALAIAREFDAHLSCLQVIPYNAGMSGDGINGLYVAPEVFDQLQDAAVAHQERVESRLRGENVAWEWARQVADPTKAIIQHSGLADLVIMTTAAAPLFKDGDRDIGPAGAICTQARGPLLAVPPEVKGFEMSAPALVAWNGSLESAHALRLALPVLARAREVHVLTVDREENWFSAADAAVYLSRHGIHAELHKRRGGSRRLAEVLNESASVADIILETARSLGAACVVSGAYGHSRFREAVFGGVTRDLLRHSDRPLLLAH